MAEEVQAEVQPQSDTIVLKSGGEGPLTLREAAGGLKKARREAIKAAQPPPETPPEAPPVAAPATESGAVPEAATTDAAPSETEALGETTAATEPEVTLPPIEPPRSWTKEERERFATLPRETQEYLAEREQERDRSFRQSQNEAAERRKAYEERLAKAEQARQQYETALPQMVAALQAQMVGEFSDIKSWDDAQKLATDDPFRYARWQNARERAAAATQELRVAQVRQEEDTKNRFTQFAKKEDNLFAEHVPEMADEAKAKTLRQNATKVLHDVGFKDDEIRDAWLGKNGVSIRDHRVQLLIRKATLWDNAQARAKEATKAPVPPVQRPGTIRPAGASKAAEIATLSKQLNEASGTRRAIEIAMKLRQARRESSA